MGSELTAELSKFGLEVLSREDIETVLRSALARGGALAELFFEETAATRIFYEGGRVDRIMDGIDRGAGLRVIFENRSVYGYTTDLTRGALVKLANALSSAVTSRESPNVGGSAGAPGRERRIEWARSRRPQGDAENAIARYRVKRSPRDASIGEKIALAARADQAARAELPGARQVTSVVLDTLRKILVVNSDGLIAPDEKTYFQMVAQVVGEKGGRVESAMESDGGYVGLEFLDRVSPESIGRRAARRVQVLLDAKPAPAGTMPVVIASEAGGTMIHEAVGHGLEADLACNGLSVYQGKTEQQVASPLISVIDDGTMLERRGSYAYDDEGTPSKRNVLIEKGVLKGYMVDKLSAMKFDLPATGNGRRESFRHKPIVRMTNTYIAPGVDDPEQILRETKYGIFVKAMGGGQVNTVTGDFVFAVTEGYLIISDDGSDGSDGHDGKQGRLGPAIRGATLVGNGPKVLSIVDRVGNDLGFATGTCGKDGQGAPVTDAQPTIRIPELTVGGEVPMADYWRK